MKTYKYTSPDNNVVHIIDEDGISRSSCLVSVLPEGAVIEAADAPTIVDQKAIKVADINAACTAAIVGGFASSALGAPHTYDSALEDQLNLIGAVGLGIDLPYRCTDATGVKEFRPHAAAQLKQVAADGAAIKLAALEKAATLKAQVQAATDASAVETVVW